MKRRWRHDEDWGGRGKGEKFSESKRNAYARAQSIYVFHHVHARAAVSFALLSSCYVSAASHVELPTRRSLSRGSRSVRQFASTSYDLDFGRRYAAGVRLDREWQKRRTRTTISATRQNEIHIQQTLLRFYSTFDGYRVIPKLLNERMNIVMSAKLGLMDGGGLALHKCFSPLI